MAEVKTYYGTEPSDSSPGTMWLRTDGTKAQRDLSSAWVEKGSWTLEDDGLLSKEGGAVTGPVTGNHGHAPLDSPAFTTIITLDGEEVPDKPWVTEQLTTLQTDLQNFITEALSGGDTGISIGNNIAFGFGTTADQTVIPLPKFSDDTRATHDQIKAMCVSLNSAEHSTSDRAVQIDHECFVDSATRMVTARCRIAAGGGGSNWAAAGTANYVIICTR